MKLDLIQPLQEGVHDPYNFKAIFMAGAPGSGKSTVLRYLFGGTGMKRIDADEIRRAYLDMGKGGDYETYGKIVRKQRQNYAENRLGIIMDTTAWWLPSIQETKGQLEELGYDVGMVHVYTPLKNSLDRVKQREQETGRHVPEEEVIKRYHALQSHLRDYADMFGDAFWFVDNSHSRPNIDYVKRHLQQWLKSAPSSAVAHKWMDQNKGRELAEQTKKISAGVIVTNGKTIVLGHTTGLSTWDIPKGGVEPGENHAAAAVRELREETGLKVSASELQPLGVFNYSPEKDLSLFLWKVIRMPQADQLDCKSTFMAKDGKSYPEFDDFAVVTLEQAVDLVNANLKNILIKTAATWSVD